MVQAFYMHRQWKLTSDSLSKMGDQIWAAKNAAYASKTASDTASQAFQVSQEQFKNTLLQMEAQTAAQLKAAKASESAAQTSSSSLDASTKQFRIEERPYITPSGIAQDGDMVDGENKIRLGILNSGRTPALKITFSYSGFLNDEPLLGASNTSKALHSEAIAAGPLPSTNHAILTLAPGHASQINSGTVRLTLKVTIKYTDIFKDWHETDICSVWYPKEKEYRYCEHGTDIE